MRILKSGLDELTSKPIHIPFRISIVTPRISFTKGNQLINRMWTHSCPHLSPSVPSINPPYQLLS